MILVTAKKKTKLVNFKKLKKIDAITSDLKRLSKSSNQGENSSEMIINEHYHDVDSHR